jgi:pyruvate/2-oxoglutarate dehydrogenase complex dihydrolipoamide dehydrogenase (E3) component
MPCAERLDRNQEVGGSSPPSSTRGPLPTRGFFRFGPFSTLRRPTGRPVPDRFDVVVIGTGPAGEVAISRLERQGLSVAVAERELIGGECAYWGCMPSKTLLRSPETRAEARRAAGVDEPALRWPALADYRDFMIRGLDDGRQVADYARRGITLVKEEGRIRGPGRVQAGARVLETDRIVIATGSDAAVPPIEGLAEAGYWTNREATTVRELPDSITVLGGGAVGVELAQFFARVGARVTLVEPHRLLAREDPALGELAGRALVDEGIEVVLGSRAERVRRADGGRVVSLQGGREIAAQEVLVATGRRPRVAGIGLETLGIEPDPEGIAVDERCRAADGVWAVGDVTGIMPFTHVGKYQARIAADDIGGHAVRADYRAIPRVVFADPEIAAVGLPASEAREQGLDVRTARVDLAEAIARPWTYEQEPRGALELVADAQRRVLLGAWAWAPMAGEWIHYAALAIKAQVSLDVLADTVAQFPTYTEAFLEGLEQL